MISRRSLLMSAAAAVPVVMLKPELGFSQEKMFGSFDIFIPSGPGGGWDGVARAFGQVGEQAGLLGGVSFENVAGAGGTVGLPRFINRHSGRDNSLIISGSQMVSAVIANKTPYGVTDLTPVARLTEEAEVIAVSPTSPYKTIDDLLKALKENSALPIGGGSAGGLDHLTLGLMLKSVGADTSKANYIAFQVKSQPLSALMENQIHAAISGYSEYAPWIEAGQMRALATTGEKRLAKADVPTLKEAGIDVVTTNWRGVFAAPKVSPEEVATLVALAERIHQLPAWTQKLADQQWDDAFLTGAPFEDFIKANIEMTTVALKAIGLA